MKTITKELQTAFEEVALAAGQPDLVPCICGFYGRACRQMGDKADRALCFRCPLADFVEGKPVRIIPQEGQVYEEDNGCRYLCTEAPGPQDTSDAATLECVEDGWTFKAHNVYQYPDGTIRVGTQTSGHWAV